MVDKGQSKVLVTICNLTLHRAMAYSHKVVYMRKAYYNDNFRFHYFAHVTAPCMIVKEIPFAFKGDIKTAQFERDIQPGMYGFMTATRRDKFVSACNGSTDTRPAFAVEIVGL